MCFILNFEINYRLEYQLEYKLENYTKTNWRLTLRILSASLEFLCM